MSQNPELAARADALLIEVVKSAERKPAEAAGLTRAAFTTSHRGLAGSSGE